MIVHPIAGAPANENVLLWDVHEAEWRIGHLRTFRDEQDHWCACTVEEAHDLITDGEPVPVFASVSHWAALPMPPG